LFATYVFVSYPHEDIERTQQTPDVRSTIQTNKGITATVVGIETPPE